MVRKREPVDVDGGIRKEENPIIEKVRSSWQVSTQYYKGSIEHNLVRNQNYFDNKHPPDSKYHSAAYRYRSKIFRPKIRSAGRKLEASATQAFFSTIDAISATPENENDMNETIAAEMVGGVLKYHLKNTMNWFQTCIGAVQDAYKNGAVFSYNYWERKTVSKLIRQPMFDNMGNVVYDEKDNPVYEEQIVEEVLEDRPAIELLPADRVRYHPSAHWINPLQTSPFVCIIRPMYIYEIKQRMSQNTPLERRWKRFNDDEIKSAMQDKTADAVQMARLGNKQDPNDLETHNVTDFDTAIVLEWFMVNQYGERETFYTLGQSYMLSDPEPISKKFNHKQVPLTMGTTILEAHKNFPVGAPELAESLQKEANDIANSRLDNIKLVLNKRYIVKRGSQTDTRSLLMNAAGGITMTTDPGQDIVPLEYSDVTGSSFAEQDRINVDADELLGSFSQSSVQSNRSLNETVGGMQMLHGSAGQLADYSLKTFVETWMEPTLKQIAALIQGYEEDERILGNIAESNSFEDRYDDFSGDVNNETMKGYVVINVNVGVGASNPVFKAEQFILAIRSFAEIANMPIPGMNLQEIAKEIFGYVGYKDGSRFFSLDEQGQVTPEVQEMQQELQKLTQQADSKQLENEGKRAIEDAVQMGETQRHNAKIDSDERIALANNKTKERIALINAKLKRDEMNKEEQETEVIDNSDELKKTQDSVKETEKAIKTEMESKLKDMDGKIKDAVIENKDQQIAILSGGKEPEKEEEKSEEAPAIEVNLPKVKEIKFSYNQAGEIQAARPEYEEVEKDDNT